MARRYTPEQEIINLRAKGAITPKEAKARLKKLARIDTRRWQKLSRKGKRQLKLLSPKPNHKASRKLRILKRRPRRSGSNCTIRQIVKWPEQ